MAKQEKTSRKDIKKKMNDEIAALKTKCNDSKFFDSQIERILSLKGQLDVEEVRFIVKEKDVLREYKGDTFYIAITKKGALFHNYGGYSFFADNRNYSSLYQTLAYFVDNLGKENPDLTDEDRENMELDFMAKTQIMLAPTWCFSDVDATYNIATVIVKELANMSEQAMEQPLSEEDEQANHDFEEAVRGAENIVGKLKQENNADAE